eukprot:m.197057 g.197057  ORF g.197057 m.197057 type:complete len:289 (+) comp17658_c0_seq3:44-910(+)
MKKSDAKSAYASEVEGNALDLSLRQLDRVSVKDLALLPLVTRVDLSNNQITALPDNFGSLTHLVHLDLSKNQLTSLPTSFGQLSSLRHLDLCHNQLNRLPLSFAELDSLTWLDLRENPLDPGLLSPETVGLCLTAKQNQDCAKRVLARLKELAARAEKAAEIKRKKMEEEAELERLRREAAEAEERQRKKAEREMRKRNAQAANQQTTNSAACDASQAREVDLPPSSTVTEQEGRRGLGSAAVCGTLLLALTSCVVAWLMMEDPQRSNEFLRSVFRSLTIFLTNAGFL